MASLMAQKFNPPYGSGGKTVTKPPMAKAPMQGPGMQEGGEEQDGSAIAQQHGPAMQVSMEHEHEMGAHHVHSMHPDGHEHHSDHASAEEAHEHGKKLAGVGAAPEKEMEGAEDSEEPWGKE